MSSPRRRVAVTGFGIVSPAGTGPDPLWRAILEQRPLFAEVSRFDTTSYPCTIGGEIADADFEDLVHPRKRRNTTRVTRLSLAAAQLALHHARFPDHLYAGDRRGVFVGTALGGWHEGSQQTALLLDRGARRINPFVANSAPHHAPGVEIAAATASRGPQLTFANGCPAGLAAIAYGANLIASGEIDACLAGGAECPITPLVFAGMGRTGELATAARPPAQASRPFDTGHSGMVLSEGACFLVLEDAEHAAERGATLHAEILGYAASCDAVGLYESDPLGQVAAASIAAALERSGLSVTDLDWICSHANSAPAFDRKEALVLHRAFGPTAATLPVSSIKGVLGHPFAAAGAFQTVAAACALSEGRIPPTANLEIPDPACQLHHVTGSPLDRRLRHVLVSSYGYGGLNGYLVLGHPDRLRNPAPGAAIQSFD
jgi:3-oxoacyl-[acyl-carrier-protein] synthase II